MPVGAAVLLAVLAVLAAFPGLVSSWGPDESTGVRLSGPSWAHPFGTDTISRDVLSRVLHGGRVSLVVGLAVAVVAGLAGTVVGLVAGWRGGRVDGALMRLTDLFLVVPTLVALILLGRLPAHQAWAATVLGPAGSVRSVVSVLSLLLWMPMARVVRGVVLEQRGRDFVLAARALGASELRIVVRHVLPACAPAALVGLSLLVAGAIGVEATLSFLGFGVPSATTPTWGNMLSAVQGSARVAPHLVWFPGAAVVVTVLCVHLLGDWARDALDPRRSRR